MSGTTRKYPKQVFREDVYSVIESSDYGSLPTGTRLKMEGVVDEKPLMENVPSQKPFEVSVRAFMRFSVWTDFVVDGVNARYYGPAFVRKGEHVTLWGKKEGERFRVVKIEAEGFVAQNV